MHSLGADAGSMNVLSDSGEYHDSVKTVKLKGDRVEAFCLSQDV